MQKKIGSKEAMEPTTYGLLGSARLTIALVGFFGCVVFYALRSDVSFAIVCMVNGTAVDDKSDDDSNKCSKNDDDDKDDDIEGDLLWSKKQQGYVLSSFFWGYLVSQIAGGELAGRFGPRIVIGLTVLFSSIVTLVCPVAANSSVYFFLALRVLLGFIQGTLFPALATLWSKWAPPLERSLLVSLNYAGNQIGVTITMPISAVLCKYGFADGWPSIYYVFGGVGILWSAIWFFYAADSPEKHRFISKAEREFIESSLGTSNKAVTKKRRVPWRAIFTSRAIWGLWGGHFASDWGAYMMMTSLPLYMNDVLGLDLTSMGAAAAAPYIAYFAFINIGGFVADKIRSANLLSTEKTRKIAMIIAMGSQGGFLIAGGYCGCGQKALVIVFVTLGIGLSGFAYAGYVVNYLDIAGSYAGPAISIGNTFTCMAGIAGPIIVGMITHSGTSGQWRLVFWITGGILVVGTLLFTFLAQGELQPWARDDLDDDDESTISGDEKKIPVDTISTISIEEDLSVEKF